METDELRRAFLGGDPQAGQAALEALIDLGDAGEELLFSSPIEMPTIHIKRRWLRFVATRPITTGPRLFDRVRDEAVFDDSSHAADLFMGLPEGDPTHERISDALSADFANGVPHISYNVQYWRVASTMYAVGAGGKNIWSVWHAVQDNYAWEKLRIHAFCAVCLAAARFGQEHLPLLERFIERGRNSKRNQTIDAPEMWFQAYYTFSLWRTGNLVDGIFTRWSTHEHIELRRFGAMVLNALAFRRAQEPLRQWISVETDGETRGLLISALARCRTTSASDAVMELAAPARTNHQALVLAAEHASDRANALLCLEDVACGNNATSAEALVVQARMGARSRYLEDALFSVDGYRRTNAALAYGLLEDRSRLNDLLALREESAGQLESLYVVAALAMLGQEQGAEALHAMLCKASVVHIDNGQLYYLNSTLRQAILTAFERGGAAAAPYLQAWAAAFEPLNTAIEPCKPNSVVPAARVPEAAERLPQSKVDLAIITIREDEFDAVLKFFPDAEEYRGSRRTYDLGKVESTGGRIYTVALLRAYEQGHASAQSAASDVLADLDPAWILIVGIAGAVPETEFCLGDVVVATRIADFSVSASLADGRTQLAAGGGPAHKAVQDIAARLPSLRRKLGDWNAQDRIGCARPKASIETALLYGDEAWQGKVRTALQAAFGASGQELERRPLVTAAAVASANMLVKNPALVQDWQRHARNIKAVEMELPGVYEAARKRTGDKPVLAIRGISDIVGYKRSPEWTGYACMTAASFARALVEADAFADDPSG